MAELHGMKRAIVTIMKPDGTNDTLSMPRTDPVGATWAYYTPETVGTYVLQAYFPGEWKDTRNSSGAVISKILSARLQCNMQYNSSAGPNTYMGRDSSNNRLLESSTKQCKS